MWVASSPSLRWVFLAGVAAVLGSGAARAAEIADGLSVRGFIEGRLVGTDGPVGWEDRGLGKLRYGSDGGWTGSGRAEATVAATLNLWSWRLVASASVDPDRNRNPVDLVELFAQYRPAPMRATQINAKVGAFFPPVSLENTALGWTSPYTLTSSAINTWVGEELRIFGAELSVVHHFSSGKVSASAATFGANDPAGALLAWRGWAVSDRKARLFERLPLAPLHVFSAMGPVPQQAPWVELTHEIDNRPGIYGALAATLDEFGDVNLVLYDNRARDTAFDGRQYAWHTRFASVGSRVRLSENLDVVAQGMWGDTSMGTPTPGQSLVNVEYVSAFALLSRTWDRHRLSARAEYFETTDKDTTARDNNAEYGTAFTLAYVFRPTERQRLTVEILRATSFRPERVFSGFERRARETQIQGSYRFFF